MLGTVLVFVAVVALPSPAAAWRVRVPGSFDAGPIAVHPSGDVFAALGRQPRSHERATAVVRLAARDGRERWRRTIRGSGKERSDFLHELEATPDGDVVAVGTVLVEGRATFFASRLAGRDGSVRWRRMVQGAQKRDAESASDVALDAQGDVVVAGTLQGSTTAQYHGVADFAVVKLAGGSGDERWRFTLNGGADQYDGADVVAVDARGDVVAVGTVGEPPIPGSSPLGRSEVTVVKLAGADGHLIWRRNVEDVWRVGGIVLDAGGDIVMAASTRDGSGNSFGVVKLAGQTGDLVWVARVSGGEGHWQEAFRVRLLPRGDVVAVGFTAEPTGEWLPTVARLDGSTGVERWRRRLRGSDGGGTGRAIEIGPSGAVLVGANLRNKRSCEDITVARLSDATGEPQDVTTIDGRSVATRCEDPYCEYHCAPPLAFDNDIFSALAVDPAGRPIVAGSVADGPRGQAHGFVARLR